MIMYPIAFLLTIMFFLSSFDKMSSFGDKSRGFGTRFEGKLFRIPTFVSHLAIVCAILIQFCCPLIIMYSIYDKKYKMYGAYASLVLAFFTVCATYLYNFPPYGEHYHPFISNVTTVGGLFLLAHNLK